jgi:hypothetical protein
MNHWVNVHYIKPKLVVKSPYGQSKLFLNALIKLDRKLELLDLFKFKTMSIIKICFKVFCQLSQSKIFQIPSFPACKDNDKKFVHLQGYYLSQMHFQDFDLLSVLVIE